MNRDVVVSPASVKNCRICLDNDNEKDLISPCLCTGESAYVHRTCLDNWRSVNKDGCAFKFCDVCQFEYAIEPVIDDPSADKRRLLKFRLLVARDIVSIILLLQAIIVGTTFLLQFVDKRNHHIQDFYRSPTGSFGIYYLTSVILFFAFLGSFGLIGLCCGLITKDDRDRCTCSGYHTYCCSMQCHGCNGNCNCGSGDGALIVLLVIVLIFAVIGIFVGLILSWIIIRKRMKRHTARLWLREEAKKYVVKDFQGRRHELGSTARTLPSAPPASTVVTLHTDPSTKKQILD